MENFWKNLQPIIEMFFKQFLGNNGFGSILQLFGMDPVPSAEPPPAPTTNEEKKPAPTPTLTNVANPTSVAEAANKAVKGTAKSPDGKPVVGFIDVGHTLIATEIIADKTGKLVEQPMSQERLNSLTYKELKEGLAKKSGEAGAITLTPGHDPGAIYDIPNNNKISGDTDKSKHPKVSESLIVFHQAIELADKMRLSLIHI